MQELEYPFDSQLIMRKRRSLKRKLLEQGGRTEKRIMILGGSTTHDIRDMLELFLLNQGIAPVFYESEYGQYWQDAMFPEEALLNFHPDIIYIHTSLRNVTEFPAPGMDAAAVEEMISRQTAHFQVMWDKLAQTWHCPVIQNNFEYPFYRLMGNQDAADIHGRTNYVTRLNAAFYEYARSHESFLIQDINYLAADYGLAKWSDPFAWHMYKYALCLDAIPALAYNLASIIKSVFGKNKKALSLDLDNTLWGGVVGDDGVEGLELGQETSMGQVYSEFQEYLKALSRQGVLLTVNSKNEEENAMAGLKHPQMVLKPEDFLVIKANWEPKSRNLVQTAEELSLLPESFVFVDDNPAERAIIRQQVPGAAVPEMTKVEHYILDIDRAGYFETTTLSADDLKRNEMYKENLARARQQSSFDNYEDYLRSLDMDAVIRAFEPVYMPRIAQLTNKSNQFNLTTKRCTQDEIADFAANPRYITLYGQLRDCFGDNGVVTVVIGEKKEDRLDIILWLMSCRVLKRGMEFAMMDELVRLASEAGLNEIRGYYYPTAKNGMVREFYAAHGFEKIQESEDGSTVWSLRPLADYQPKNQVIRVNQN
ncbi:MAG: HAD family hydrolase [Lachnospiraceae bacterium]|nr:HAD family hydrolase [Lachnospiraceae bacterium]